MSHFVSVEKISKDKECSNCGTWLKHWEKCRNKRATKCSVIICNETENLQGVHVNDIFRMDSKSFIIPLCNTHAHLPLLQSMEVSTTLISSNPRHSCKRF